MSNKMKIISGVVVVLTLMVGVGISKYLLSTPPKAERTPPPKKSTPVDVISLSPSKNRVLLESVGTIYPKSQTTITAQVSGKVAYVNPKLKAGASFKKDEVLVRLEDVDYKSALLQKESELARMEAALQIEDGEQTIAKKEYELMGRKLSPKDAELILRVPQLKQAIANLESAKAGVQKAKADLDRTVIKAPYDGSVIKSSVSIGQFLGGGTTVLEFLDTESFYVEAEPKESELLFLDFGTSKAKVHPISTQTSTPKDALLLSMIPQVDAKSKRARVLLEIKEPLGGAEPLLTGSSVKIEIIGKEIEDSVLLPINLLKEGDSIWLFENGELLIKKIEIVNMQGKFVLAKNIKSDEKIITTNLSAPVVGMSLSIKDKKQKKMDK